MFYFSFELKGYNSILTHFNLLFKVWNQMIEIAQQKFFIYYEVFAQFFYYWPHFGSFQAVA